jgi:YVTN family beta-propeller protein
MSYLKTLFVASILSLPSLTLGSLLPYAYVASIDNSNNNFVDVINTSTQQLIATIPVGSSLGTVYVGATPIALSSSPSLQEFYVLNNDANGTVSVINVLTNNLITTIPVEAFPSCIAITPNGKQAYVTNIGDATVSVIDTSTYTIQSVTVGADPQTVTITPNGKQAYVTNTGSGSVSIIDTSTYAIQSVTVGNGPQAVAITPNGKQAYVANASDTTVSIIDTSTYAVQSVTVGNSPVAIAITPDGKQVYVANNDSNTVSIIDTRSLQVSTIQLQTKPYGITISRIFQRRSFQPFFKQIIPNRPKYRL